MPGGGAYAWRMARVVRWTLAALGAVLIAIGLYWMFAPDAELFGEESAGFFGTPVFMGGEEESYNSAVAVFFGLMLATQYLFLRPAGGWKMREKSEGRPMRLAAAGAGFCAMLLSAGLIAALLEVPGLWVDVVSDGEGYHPVVYVVLLALWVLWAFVFHRYGRNRRGVLRSLIAGTFVELLVAASVHAAYADRDDCYCARGSYTALVFGGTALFWVFGPGIYLLYRAERARRRRIIRTCPGCGHDLSGSAAEVCPACGANVPIEC